MREPALSYLLGWRRLLGYLLLSGIGLAVGCSGTHEPAHQAAAKAAQLDVKPSANVPAMLGKSIDDLRRQLQPATEEPSAVFKEAYANLAPTATDSVVVLRANGLSLVVCYSTSTRQVRDLVLLGRHEDILMRRGALSPNSPNYLLLPVFWNDRPGIMLGLRITAIKEREHKLN